MNTQSNELTTPELLATSTTLSGIPSSLPSVISIDGDLNDVSTVWESDDLTSGTTDRTSSNGDVEAEDGSTVPTAHTNDAAITLTEQTRPHTSSTDATEEAGVTHGTSGLTVSDSYADATTLPSVNDTNSDDITTYVTISQSGSTEHDSTIESEHVTPDLTSDFTTNLPGDFTTNPPGDSTINMTIDSTRDFTAHLTTDYTSGGFTDVDITSPSVQLTEGYTTIAETSSDLSKSHQMEILYLQ